MDVSGYTHSGSITIDRPPDAVYAIISDVSRIGDLSPVCRSASWDDPARAGKKGAWFTGNNEMRDFKWSTHCQVVAAEPSREFAWTNHGPTGEAELVRWGYVLEPDGQGTTVTESWQVLPAYPEFVKAGDPEVDIERRLDRMAQIARDGIAETLANLKRVAEA